MGGRFYWEAMPATARARRKRRMNLAIALIKKLKDFSGIILIDTAPAEIFYRIKTAAHKEGFYPAFLGENIKNEKEAEDRFFSIYKRRMKIYKALASFSINPKGLSPDETADKIISSL